MLKTWVFEFLPELTDEAAAASNRTADEYVAGYLALWQRDEALGFDGIFFSEHHFGGSFSSSPNLLIAATAGRTKTLRLGVMGVVVPYYPASRVVEEIGLLDLLSGGRLEIGTAVGIPQELAKVGLSMDEARAIYNEVIEILDSALETGVAHHTGKYFKYDNLRLLPRPVQKPSPPKWSTIVSVDMAQRAVHRNSKICTGFVTKERARDFFDAYLAEAQRMGKTFGGDHLGLRRRVVVADSQSAAQEMSEAAAERFRKLSAGDSRMKASQVPDAPGKSGGFSMSADEFIFGTPEQVAENIIDQCRYSGARNFLAVLHWGADLDEVRAGHESFGQKVLPILKKAGL